MKMFCEITDIVIPWKKITRGIPRGKRYADDRAPTIEEIHKIIEYPDRRIKPIVYTMASSGIRVGAWDHLKWSHISPIIRDGKLLAARINVYAGEDDEYITFITPEAYLSLESWMKYRSNVENMSPKTVGLCEIYGMLQNSQKRKKKERLTSRLNYNLLVLRRLVERALWAQGIRTVLERGQEAP